MALQALPQACRTSCRACTVVHSPRRPTLSLRPHCAGLPGQRAGRTDSTLHAAGGAGSGRQGGTGKPNGRRRGRGRLFVDPARSPCSRLPAIARIIARDCCARAGEEAGGQGVGRRGGREACPLGMERLSLPAHLHPIQAQWGAGERPQEMFAKPRDLRRSRLGKMMKLPGRPGCQNNSVIPATPSGQAIERHQAAIHQAAPQRASSPTARRLRVPSAPWSTSTASCSGTSSLRRQQQLQLRSNGVPGLKRAAGAPGPAPGRR